MCCGRIKNNRHISIHLALEVSDPGMFAQQLWIQAARFETWGVKGVGYEYRLRSTLCETLIDGLYSYHRKREVAESMGERARVTTGGVEGPGCVRALEAPCGDGASAEHPQFYRGEVFSCSCNNNE